MLAPNKLVRYYGPIRTVLRWQVAVTAACAVLGGLFGGIHGAFSALLGGMVSVLGGLASARTLAGARQKGGTAARVSSSDVLIGALKAEMVKVAVIVLLLWLVFALYKDVNPVGFIGTFALTTVIFSLAIAVREK